MYRRKPIIFLFLIMGFCAGCGKIDLPEVARTAARSVRPKKQAEIRKELERLQYQDPAAREDAALRLRSIGDQSAVDGLIGALYDNEWRVRKNAADALGHIGHKNAVLPLLERLQDEQKTVRIAAARALGRCKDKRAVYTLILSLQDRNDVVRITAARALRQLTRANPGDDFSSWMDWYSRNPQQ